MLNVKFIYFNIFDFTWGFDSAEWYIIYWNLWWEDCSPPTPSGCTKISEMLVRPQPWWASPGLSLSGTLAGFQELRLSNELLLFNQQKTYLSCLDNSPSRTPCLLLNFWRKLPTQILSRTENHYDWRQTSCKPVSSSAQWDPWSSPGHKGWDQNVPLSGEVVELLKALVGPRLTLPLLKAQQDAKASALNPRANCHLVQTLSLSLSFSLSLFSILLPFATLISLYFMCCKKSHNENPMDKIREINLSLQFFVLNVFHIWHPENVCILVSMKEWIQELNSYFTCVKM